MIPVQPGKSEFLSGVEDIILKNLDNDQFDVSGMARHLGMSRSSLHRKLKAATGIPASEFIRSFKLEKAVSLLKESTANITEIAFECGFRSLTYFDICFKDQYGYPPSKIRKDLNQEAGSEKVIEAFSTTEKTEDTETKPKNQLHNFPLPVTSFVGRKKEMETILEMLKVHRVVSLVGSGGCGKTRLACEVVARSDQEFSDGIWFVDLAPVENGEFVAKEIMKTLKIPESIGEEQIDTLVRKLKEMRLLILLDNCEHLAKACTEVAGRLIQSVAGLTIMTTSRMILDLKGEKIWRIPSLSLIDPEKVTMAQQAKKSDAVLLFTDRARMHDPRFELVNENSREIATICKRIDGIPLAIEVVASRIRYMEPATMLNRLSGKFSELESHDPVTIERHRTLNATIDWSYNLLMDEEKNLFRRLSVFAGGFDMETVETVCKYESLPEEYILDILSNLVDRSMVNTIRRPGKHIRYYLLETLRQYASGLLLEKEETRLRKSHLEYFINMAEKAYQERMSSQAFWMEKLNLEHDNMLVALNWSENHNLTKFNRLASALAWFWTRSDNSYLARKILGGLISAGKIRSEVKARILTASLWANNGRFDQYPKHIGYLNQSVSIWHRLGNKKEEAVALSDLALIHYSLQQDETGLKIALKAYEIAQIENDPAVILYCMIPVSQGLVDLKRIDEAKSTAMKLLEMAEELGNILAQFFGNHNYGDCCLMEGNFLEAERSYAKGVKVTSQFGDMYYLFTELTGIAMAVAGMGRYRKALRLLGAVNKEAKKAGTMSVEDLPLQFWQELVKQHIVGTREKLGEELTRKYESEGQAMDLEEAIRYALDFDRD